jgi:5-formyltetrahydrofolate cyclo-ligase
MTDAEVLAWRRRRRAALLAARQEMPLEERQLAARIIAERLDALVAARYVANVGLYWPIKHEINLLPWAEALARRKNTVLCLPVVVTKRAPLEYWRWSQGDQLARGIWDIPIPTHRDVVVPDLVLAPLVGFDKANYRLGYGGGYFDRTLAALRPRPIAIGIGFDAGFLETIHPLSHDIPMDAVVTEKRETLSPDWRNRDP